MISLKDLPKEISKYSGVISEKVVLWHHDKHQAGYVSKYNEIIEQLAAANKSDANANYSIWGELKRRQSFNHAGIVLHENYWRVFGSDGKFNEKASIIQKIIADYGSFENWRSDFIATGKSALGWVVCVWDSHTDKIVNVSVDYHNLGAFWDSIVLVACDVFEHAYYSDYGPDRANYLEKFVNSLDWTEIEKSYTGDFDTSSSGCGGNCGSKSDGASGCGCSTGELGCSGNCNSSKENSKSCCGQDSKNCSENDDCCGKCEGGDEECSCEKCGKKTSNV